MCQKDNVNLRKSFNFWKSKEEILQRRETDKIFEPSMSEERRTELYSGWKKAVERAKKWSE